MQALVYYPVRIVCKHLQSELQHDNTTLTSLVRCSTQRFGCCRRRRRQVALLDGPSASVVVAHVASMMEDCKYTVIYINVFSLPFYSETNTACKCHETN